jgi:enoyl-CoA hydratase/carnithine racemase
VSALVRLERSGGTARVILDRPEVLNALSFDTLGELGGILAALRDDPAVRVVLFTGAGGKAFCAGADLKERAGFDEQQTRAFVARIGATFDQVAALPQPTLAVLNGVAFGGGLELALACDLRVAERGVKLGLTETSLAIIPGAGGTQRLPRVVGVAKAKELILCGSRIDADEALAIGLVNAVAEPDALEACAAGFAAAIEANGPLAVRAAKEAIDLYDSGSDDGALARHISRERELYLERVLPSADRLEALAAFREKRKPVYRGK